MDIMTLGIAGGLFALLALVHFVVDWIFQTHAEAMVKHNNPRVRAKHCLIYTLGFIPLLYFFDYSWLLIGLNILFWSHFIEDTYVPVFLWAKHIRKPPEMVNPAWEERYWELQGQYNRAYRDRVIFRDNQELSDIRGWRHELAKSGFVLFIQTPLGKILMIAVDQIIHLCFLIPLIYMALS